MNKNKRRIQFLRIVIFALFGFAKLAMTQSKKVRGSCEEMVSSEKVKMKEDEEKNNMNSTDSWQSIVRLLTYRFVFHPMASKDVEIAVHDIVKDSTYKISKEEYVAAIREALEPGRNLNNELYPDHTISSDIDAFLRELLNRIELAD